MIVFFVVNKNMMLFFHLLVL